MKIAKKRVFGFAILAIFILSCLFLGSSILNKNKVYAYEGNNFEEQYFIGKTLNIPNVNIDHEGKTYPSERFEVVYPDGNKKDSDEISLSLAGNYTVTYYANSGKLKLVESFVVVSERYGVTSISSTVEYKDAVRLSYNKESGLEARIADRDFFTYNQPININGDGLEDIISLYYYNNCKNFEGQNGRGFQTRNITIRMTDCYNPNVWVDIQMYYSPSEYYPYVTAGANDQTLTGISKGQGTSSDYKIINGEMYRVFYNSWGRYMRPEANVSYTSSDKPIAFYYEESTKRLYFTTEHFKEYQLITDLDEPILNDNLFKGFTTGEVYVSIFGSEYLNGNTQFEVNITSIGDYVGSDLSMASIEDTTAPVIKVDRPITKNNVYAVKDKPFKVFDATAYDANSSNVVNTYVYRDYGTQNQTFVSMQDGYFTPNGNRKYTIEYSSVDNFGYKTVETVEVFSVNGFDGLPMVLTVDKVTGKAGDTIVFPAYSVKGINGDVDVTLYYKYEDEEKTLIENNELFLENSGKYTFIYEYTDGYYNETYSYTLDCKPSDTMLLLDGLPFPKYYIKNATYSFNDAFVYSFEESKIKKNKIDVYISQDGGEYKALNKNKEKITASNTVKFKLKCNNWEEETENYPVVDVNYSNRNALKLEKYFIGDNAVIEKSANLNGCQIRVDDNDKTQTVDFINVLSLSNFSVDFIIPTNYSDYEKVSFVLTDVNNANKVAKVSYYKEDEKVYMSVNDTSATLINGKEFASTFSLSYDSLYNAFVENNTYNALNPVEFTSDEVFLSIVFEGVKDESAITIKTLCNQSMLAIRDTASPLVDIVDPVSGVIDYNTTGTFKPILSVCDVYAVIANEFVSLSVTTPSGEYAIANDGTELFNANITTRSYEYTFKEFGEYTITYVVTDPLGSSYFGVYVARVVDVTAPEIVISERGVVGYKLGTTVKLAEYEVSDNHTATKDLVVTVAVVDTNGVMTFVSDGKFKVTKAGYYRVIYNCYDANGNYASASYKIYVK
ncbi:MAG: hypothetical protein IKA85_00905 [Clostridia bacterium]|nr:hypothetical protein [Clostridia bacterium]